MRIKIGLTVLAGAVALACSGGAFAQTTNAGAGGTIFVNIVDTTNDTSFVFDTGLSVASFTDPTSYSTNLAQNASSSTAYAAFLAGESSGDVLDYSVVGNYVPASGTPADVSVVTASSKPTTTVGSISSALAANIGTFINNVNNPAGGATYQGLGTNSLTTWEGGYEPSVNQELGGGSISDNAAIGTSLAFYTVTTNNPNAARGGAAVSAFAGTWDLTSAGVLTYSEPGGGSPVPLPTPLLLLLSGLGLMGLVARRGQSASSQASLSSVAA